MHLFLAAGDAPLQLLHPLRYWGYEFWSGLGSDFSEATIATGMVALLLGFWHQHNCHVHRCWRLQWHPHPEHGHPVCKHHHPDDPKQLTSEGTNE